MKQILIKAGYNAGWGGSSQYLSLGGVGAVSLSATFGINFTNCVIPISGILRNLTVQAQETHPDFGLTVMINNAPTSLAISLPAGTDQASNTDAQVSVSAGDSVTVRVQVFPPGSGTGYPISLSLEFEGDEQWYGTQPFTGSVSTVTNPARRAGVFSNGQFTVSPWPISGTLSNTYSLVAAAGNITSLWLHAYAGPPGSGVWTGYLIKNGVLQDGTGGTVNTLVTLTGSNVDASSDFTLPVTLGDHVETVVRRTVSNAPFALAQVGASITFDPDDDESFQFVGGSNATFSETDVNWFWVETEQLETPETKQTSPVGFRGLTATGLYIELSSAPGAGNSWTFMLRKNGADTNITFTISDSETTGQILGQEVIFEFGDVIVLQVTPASAPADTRIYWGLISLVDEEVVVPGAGIYQLVPGKRYDTLYTDLDGNTQDVAIPHPYAQTAWLGK